MDAQAATVHLHLQVTGPVRDTPIERQPCDGSRACPRGREVLGCRALCASTAALQPDWPCQGKAQQYRLIRQVRGRRRGQHTQLCLHESLWRCPGLRETALAAGPALSEERKCLNELDGFSVSRERTGSETGSKIGSRPAGLVLWHRVASVQELSQESSSEEAVTASLSFCHPTQELLGSWTDPSSSSSRIKTALNYLSRIVSTTQVVLIIQCNLQVPPGL